MLGIWFLILCRICSIFSPFNTKNTSKCLNIALFSDFSFRRSIVQMSSKIAPVRQNSTKNTIKTPRIHPKKPRKYLKKQVKPNQI